MYESPITLDHCVSQTTQVMIKCISSHISCLPDCFHFPSINPISRHILATIILMLSAARFERSLHHSDIPKSVRTCARGHDRAHTSSEKAGGRH